MSGEILVLGGRDPGGKIVRGWHQRQLIDAAARMGWPLSFADYESIGARVSASCVTCVAAQSPDGTVMTNRSIDEFDAVLTRTMPAGSFEKITFRLATLHDEWDRQNRIGRCSITNPPRALELAIDKYATLARASRLGIPVPSTEVVQNRDEAMNAFDSLGGDVVCKPIFGGEGRGVMRLRERELAWTVFSTLSQTGSVMYVQKFVPPGGVDLRVLVIGHTLHAIRRFAEHDFRTNVRGGGRSQRVAVDPVIGQWARQMCDSMDLTFAAVDFLETDKTDDVVLVEVNAIPGWRGAQSVIRENIAERILQQLRR